MDELNYSGKQWRLCDASGRDARRVRAVLYLPELGRGEVIGWNGMVDNRRQHAILPLPTQERANLCLCARLVKVREPQRDQGRIPVPLMRILVRPGFGEDACIVTSQN